MRIKSNDCDDWGTVQYEVGDDFILHSVDVVFWKVELDWT